MSGELSGLFWFGLPFGGVVNGISMLCVGHNRDVSNCGRSPYFLCQLLCNVLLLLFFLKN